MINNKDVQTAPATPGNVWSLFNSDEANIEKLQSHIHDLKALKRNGYRVESYIEADLEQHIICHRCKGKNSVSFTKQAILFVVILMS